MMTNIRAFAGNALLQVVLILGVSLILGLLTNNFREQGLPLVGDWSVEARMSSPEGESLIISLEDARALHENGKAVFIDARPDVWYEMGHIKGALNVPTEEVEARYPAVLGDVDKNTPIITYCDGESCELSHDLALALLERGCTNVRVLVNGWTLWSEASLPTEGSGS